jgi:hypothetical protein
MAGTPARWIISSSRTGCATTAVSRIRRPASTSSTTTNQFHGLAYLSDVIDPDTRVSLILGGFDGSFQIPNNPGQSTPGLNVNGVTNFNSATLNETQRKMTAFAVLSLQKHFNNKDVQLSVFNRTSTLNFSPDTVGDLLFTGIACRAERSNYFDVGISQIVVPGLTLGVDGYYKQSKNLIDEGQFGARSS